MGNYTGSSYTHVYIIHMYTLYTCIHYTHVYIIQELLPGIDRFIYLLNRGYLITEKLESRNQQVVSIADTTSSLYIRKIAEAILYTIIETPVFNQQVLIYLSPTTRGK